MTEGKPIRVLEDMDIASLTWAKLKKHYEDRLQYLRRQNDADLTPEQTAKLRGSIREVKNSIALGDSLNQSMQEADEG